MAKRERDRFAALAAEIGSSRVVASIDRAIEENERERIELFELRKLAVRRHGEPEPAGPAAAENSASPKADQRSGAFDGTMAGLIRSYLADDRSPYHALRHVTKSGYSRLLDRIVSDCGDLKLSELTGRNIQDFYDGWTDGGAKRAMGHSLVTMVRLLIGYGAAAFEDKDCLRLSGVLRTIRFSPAKPRGERMTAEYAKAIIRRAHGVEMPSIALAQAFQFDCALRQKDVIGEWVPQNEPGVSDVMFENEKWLRGIRWNQIDGNLILRHSPSIGGDDIALDLRKAPLVMAEFALIGTLHKSGPIIIHEETELPYVGWRFRRIWRQIANEAGVPKDVWNTDSRTSADAERPVRERVSDKIL